MVFDELLLLPKPCSTRKAARRSPGRTSSGTWTTPESFSPADGMVTAVSVIGRLRYGQGSGGLYLEAVGWVEPLRAFTPVFAG